MENNRDIYITDAGSTACDNPYLDVSFGDPKSVISFNLKKGINGDSGFIDMFERKKIFELIKNLKRFNKVYIKFGTNCSVNNFEISLKGSSSNLSKIFSDVDFSSFNPNIDFGKFFSEKNKVKISQSISFANIFFKKNRLEFSPFDLRTIHSEIEDGILLRGLTLTEIEVLKHEFLKTEITLKLGFENLYYKETPRIYIKNLPVKED